MGRVADVIVIELKVSKGLRSSGGPTTPLHGLDRTVPRGAGPAGAGGDRGEGDHQRPEASVRAGLGCAALQV
jgi:hypothetical protein